jgi:hypothetical protein
LERLQQVVLRDDPELYDSIPSPDGIDIKKLGQHGLVMTDSCNAAQKARRLLQHEIGGIVHEMDCHHHLRNVWIKGMEKSVSVFLRVIMSDSLEQIPAELRVTCIFSAIARAWDKFFSLCANYPKGQGEHFAAWLRVNKPGTALYHVVGAQGSRHDLCLEAAPAIYMNRYVCFDYASYVLRLPKKQDNILLRCLFVLMTSEEIIAQSRLYAILYISFCVPMRWLAAKTPELGKWGWGPISNGDAIDTLREKMMDLIDDPSKVLNEDFMMNMFQKYVDALPPFKSYLEHLFQKKRMNVVASESGATVLQFAELRTELFSPSDSTNAGTNGRLIELARVAAQGILDELHDEKKATWKYLSVSESTVSFLGCPKEVKEGLYGREATNDRSESALGGTTQQLQQYGRIGIANAAAISDAKRNGYFHRFSATGKKTKGMFHQFDPKMRECLLTMAIEDSPVTVATNRDDLDRQREAKRKKEEMIEKKSLDKAKEELVEASYYWEMYNSDVCWKGQQSIVKKMLGRLKSDSAKLEALKENIRMRVVGLGWKQFTITWSSKGAKRSVDELTTHLKMIIREEKRLTTPKDPALYMPKRPELPILGTASRQLIESNTTATIDEDEFRKQAEELRRQREARGEGSIFSIMQPLYCPELDELINKRIDVLYSFKLESGEKALRWCQGKVIKILTEKTKPTVVVRWDPMPDVLGKEDRSDETQQELPQRKWNKDVEGAWRMDINVGFVEDSNVEVSERHIDLGVECDFESRDSESDEEESSASESNSD